MAGMTFSMVVVAGNALMYLVPRFTIGDAILGRGIVAVVGYVGLGCFLRPRGRSQSL